MNKLIQEAMEVVDLLNDEFFAATGSEDVLPFAFVYATYFFGIEYISNSNIIWDNCDYDTRKVIKEDEDVFEPLINCVRRELKAYHDKIEPFIKYSNKGMKKNGKKSKSN